MAARGGAYIAKVKQKNQVSDSRAIMALLFDLESNSFKTIRDIA